MKTMKIIFLVSFCSFLVVICEYDENNQKSETAIDTAEDESDDDSQSRPNLLTNVRNCFYTAMPQYPPEPSIDKISVKYNYGDPILEIESAMLSEGEMKFIGILADCVKKADPHHFEDRNFDLGSTGYGGGNNVTYLGGFMQELWPDLVERIRYTYGVAADTVGWRPHISHLGIRCIELLLYTTGGELLFHQDTESIYTAVIMMADPQTYEGGEFVIQKTKKNSPEDRTAEIRVKAGKSHAIMFNSNAEHGVTRITGGQRVVFVIEFWNYQDTSEYALRPAAKYYADKCRETSFLMIDIGEWSFRWLGVDLGRFWGVRTERPVVRRWNYGSRESWFEFLRSRTLEVHPEFVSGLLSGAVISATIVVLFRWLCLPRSTAKKLTKTD